MLIRLATRSSAQATAQAQAVSDAITTANPSATVELVFVETIGDQLADVPLHAMGGQGVFVKEVQRAVIHGYAEIAVHSAKDLPSTQADGLVIGAFCTRRDPLVGSLRATVPTGALVASGSVRRRAQLAVVRPDLRFAELRGNIQTRLGKIPDGGAIVMAVAALQILGLTDRIAEVLDPQVFVPAPGQGCVAVECRVGDEATLNVLAGIDHEASRTAVEIERSFLAQLGSGCSLPVGAHAVDGQLTAFLASAAADTHLTRSIDLSADHGAALGQAAALAAAMHAALPR
jgi:hydroxymethylbilane synthase